MACLSNERPELDLDSGKGRNMNFSCFLADRLYKNA